MRQAGVLTGDWLQVDSMQDLSSVAVQHLTYPVVVKPNSGGSSIGTQIVHDPSTLPTAVEALLPGMIV